MLTALSLKALAFALLYAVWCRALCWLVSTVDRGVPDKKRPPPEGSQRKGRMRRKSWLKRVIA